MRSVSLRSPRRGTTCSPEPVLSTTLLLYHYLLLFTALTLYIKHIKVTLKLALPRPASEKMLRWCQGGRRHQNRLCTVLCKYATLLHGTRLLHKRLSDLCIMLRLPRTSMAEKPSLSINYHTGTIQGPSAVMSHLFATPKTKSWDWLPEATIVISDPQHLQQTVARLRQLGYPLVESPTPRAE